MRKLSFDDVADPANRGAVLDVLVFVLNVVLLHWLGGALVRLLGALNAGDAAAVTTTGTLLAAMFVLPAAGAVLRRWHFHERMRARGEEPETAGCGCIWPFYLSTMLVIAASVAVIFGERVLGEDFHDGSGVFVLVLGGVLLLAGIQTALVFRYFAPPRRPPRSAFLRSRASEWLGDACIFANMLLYQTVWNIFVEAFTQPVGGVDEFIGRLFGLAFVSLLVYFPARMFYLAEDFGSARTWAMIALANSPHLVRMVLGAAGG
jgi:hypothetical protein